MASDLKKLSDVDFETLNEVSDFSVVIVRSTYYQDITSNLYNGAASVLEAKAIKKENLHVLDVPGSYELVAGAVIAAEKFNPDCVICLGCVIKGETSHDDYINQAVATGLANLTIKYKFPFIFGLLTTNTLKQAEARSGGDKGNKGTEAAIAAVQMLHCGLPPKRTHKAGFNR
ncbi:MAG: 6,7-dimethyl-8-ribityllumazine synthase [Chitinophagales bacterium]|nr:6,7-dimethyl-8-ribityllumazine synthase [Chitinophagales bacterium]